MINSRKILLVEDDELASEIIFNFLVECGFDVASVFTATDGVAYIKHESYDLLILDINLPDFNGYEVLKSIKLNKDYTYLNIYAGGNKAKVMPFYKALELLGNLEYTYQIDNLFEKKMYPVNIDTLDNAYNTRSRYKIDYLDYTPNKYNIILGAVQPYLFTKVYKKALKEAQNYVILFSSFFTDIKCNYIYKITEDSCFYVWDISNLEKPMFHRKIKNNKVSKFDYTKLTWAHTIQ